MATPVLDKEIVKLRRRIGDTFNEDGTEITTANVGASSDTGVTWKRDELLDIYHDSVRLFMDQVTKELPKEKWYEYLHGYIHYAVNVVTSSARVDISVLAPPLFKVLDVKKSGVVTSGSLASETSPSEYFAVLTKNSKARTLSYTLLSDGVPPTLRLYLLPDTFTGNVDLIYVRSHEDILHGATNDFTGVSAEGLRLVQLVAEQEAMKYRLVNKETV